MTTTLLDLRDVEFLCALVHERSAIVLDTRKEYLLRARLEPLARKQGLSGLAELVDRLRADTGRLTDLVVDALTTNETSWFRDVAAFEALRNVVLPKLVERRRSDRQLRIWSAAASTGQELYSVAMVLRDDFPEVLGWDVKLLGTDLSPSALARARAGRYSPIEMNRGLPSAALLRHFERDGFGWRAGEQLRSMVEWREMNLARSWPVLPPFDLVLLRNVLIYFDGTTKQQVFDRMARVLRLNGFLMLGSAETPPREDGRWARVALGAVTLYTLDNSGSDKWT
ncbi:MAG: chemotaxis protein methyltransferase [Acidimicrobiia bacterium]|nr:MAG: chemotaxis protein methyltransferase [Acidimicrobiia bacterium]